MTNIDEAMTARQAPAEGYLEFAQTLLETDFPSAADGFLELAGHAGWPVLESDANGATLGRAWTGLENRMWKAAFTDGAVASFWTPIGYAEQPTAAAKLFEFALANAEPVLGPPLWTSSELYVRAWQGAAGVLMLDSVGGELRLEYVPHAYRARAAAADKAQLDPTWEGLHAAITAEVGRWAQNDCMIFSFGDHCVQLIQDPDLIHVEIPVVEPDNSWLTAGQQQLLAAQGWLPPDPPGWYAWRKDLPFEPGPGYCTQVADLVVHALRDLCQVTTPAALEIQSFNVHGGAFTIGVQPEDLALAAVDAAWRHSTSSLTTAGIAYAAEQVFAAGSRIIATAHHPARHRVSQPTGDHQFPNSDLLVWTGSSQDKRLLAVHVVPPDCTLAARYVPNPATGGKGPHLNAEQGTGAYLRYLLEHHPGIGAALNSDPHLHAVIGQHVADHGIDGISCQKLAINGDGTLHTAGFVIAAGTFGTHPVTLAASGDQQ